MFSHVECPAILIDAQHRVIASNRPGHELLSAGVFVSLVDGRLVCADPASHTALLAALAAGWAGAPPGHPVLHVAKTHSARRDAGRQLGVGLTVLAPAYDGGGDGALADGAVPIAAVTVPLMLLTFQNAPLSSLDLAENAARCFGLTTAQARVATELANGKTIKQIAFYSGVSVNTVRHHVKAIFAKTGTNRQVELVQMLGRLAQRGTADGDGVDQSAAKEAPSAMPVNGVRAGGGGPPASSAPELLAH